MIFQLRNHLPTAALAFLVFFFAFHALTGQRGLLMQHQRAEQLADRQAELAHLQATRAQLENEVRNLRDDHLSADLLEERAHRLLGFVDPRDYVIRQTPSRS
ncbi:MAG: septum formation initiator family protein [Alphaproteobacteria bacterium]|jgi:cell division protein FtsB|nr:septum formation initiator family protein [Alphaproteobacteria bacterium]